MSKSNRHAYWIFCLTVVLALGVYFILPHRLGQSQEPESPGAVFMVTNNLDTGAGSLRQALTDANAAAGTDTINFQIGSGSAQINIDTALPIITGPVVIDGATQAGFVGTPLIILRRNNAPVATNGLQISGGGSTVKSLAIIRFNHGVMLESAGGHTVTGCFIGIDPRDEATTASSNSGNGILIMNSPNNQVGGNTPAARNVIGRNLNGIQIDGTSSSGNVITGNYIGLRSNGSDLARNGRPPGVFTDGHGVFINGAPNNRIGGSAVGERNIISGNTDPGQTVDNQVGVRIDGATATGNTVLGNFIGTDVTGTLARPNSFGISLFQAINNNIGGTIGTTPGGACTGACNLIAGNRRDPLIVGGNLTAGSPGGNVIEGNFFGLNVTGTAMLLTVVNHNITISGSSNNRVGGSTPAARNVLVAGSGGAVGPAHNIGIIAKSENNVVSGNYIGTDTTGTVAIGSAEFGVIVSNVPGGNARFNRIGGTTAGERNVISGGNRTGIEVGGNSNTIQGNYIGTDATGTQDLGNTQDGISLAGINQIVGTAAGTTLGGACTGGCNLISGNNRDGVRIESLFTSGHRIDYNYIGLNAEGLSALRNGGNAISLRNGANNIIIGKPPAPPPMAVEAENAPDALYCIQDDGTGDFVTINDETNECTITRCRTGETRTGSARIGIGPGVGIRFESTQLHLTGHISLTSGDGRVFDTAGELGLRFMIDADTANSSCTCPTEGDGLIAGEVNITGTDTTDNSLRKVRINIDRIGDALPTEGPGVNITSASRTTLGFGTIVATTNMDSVNLSIGGTNNDTDLSCFVFEPSPLRPNDNLFRP